MSSFQKLIQSEIPILVDFTATWCGPCKSLAPILKQVAQETKGKARIVKIDIDKNQDIAQQLAIKGVPTLIIYKKGVQLWRQSGVLAKHELLAVLKRFM